MENPRPSLTVVVPAYNSEQTLEALVERLQPVLAAHASQYELVLVNDGSRDNSWGVIQTLTGKHNWIRGINMMRNYGQHNAVLCGIRAARYDVVVTMDDDLQHPPEEIPRLLEKLNEGFDVVYGTPQQEQHGVFRDLASQITKIALKSAMGSEVGRNVSAYRALRTNLRQAFANYQSPFVSVDVLLTWGSTRFAAVPVAHDPRRIGVSNYNLRKLVTHAINMMTGFSTLPLQIASWIGFAFTVFGILILFYVLFIYLTHGRGVPGFAFLASIVAIFSGAQLFALGIIGEYLARMHLRMMERPVYVVREKAGHDE